MFERPAIVSVFFTQSSDSAYNTKIRTFQNYRTKISTQTDVCPYLIRLRKCLNRHNFYIPYSDCDQDLLMAKVFLTKFDCDQDLLMAKVILIRITFAISKS